MVFPRVSGRVLYCTIHVNSSDPIRKDLGALEVEARNDEQGNASFHCSVDASADVTLILAALVRGDGVYPSREYLEYFFTMASNLALGIPPSLSPPTIKTMR